MANVKITDLTAYTDPVNTDVLPIVDVTSDVTKKVSIGNLMKNASLGTAATPGIAFDGDPNTGIYSPGADQVALSTGGTGRLFVDSSGRVGIGTSSPGAKVDIVSENNTSLASVLRVNSNNVAVNTSLAYDGLIGSGQLTVQAGTSAALIFGSNATERARIDTSGRLLVGTSSARTNVYVGAGATAPKTQFELNTNSYTGLSLLSYSASGYEPILNLGISLSNTAGANTAIVNNSTLATVNFIGNDGTNFRSAAWIQAQVDGTPGAADMPGRLVFSTTADGASTPTERMRIKSTGTINFSSVAVYADNAAATTGGLAVGDVYRTSTGQLMIRY